MLHVGDCLDILPGIADASVDAVVTDPPYSLAFMGREWDRFKPSEFQAWCEKWAAECLRVLKPGGHLLAFGGTRTYHRLACGIEDAGFEIRDSLHWIYGSGFPKSLDVSKAIDKRRDDYPAIRWEGWGTALKPAHEPIVLARKPLAGTVAGNVLAHGTGALNVDGCRVAASAGDYDHLSNALGRRDDETNWRFEARKVPPNDAGRWPPNVLLGPEAAEELDRQSGTTRDGTAVRHRGVRPGMYGPAKPLGTPDMGYGGAGGASRFFPVFRYQAKATSKERPRLPDGTAHPTVKPVALMRWLVRLVTPPGGLVLDPFAGSGTTGEAAILEGFRYLLIEKDPASAELIRQRLAKPLQPGLDMGAPV